MVSIAAFMCGDPRTTGKRAAPIHDALNGFAWKSGFAKEEDGDIYFDLQATPGPANVFTGETEPVHEAEIEVMIYQLILYLSIHFPECVCVGDHLLCGRRSTHHEFEIEKHNAQIRIAQMSRLVKDRIIEKINVELTMGGILVLVNSTEITGVEVYTETELAAFL